jgi:hypothetical protein
VTNEGADELTEELVIDKFEEVKIELNGVDCTIDGFIFSGCVLLKGGS